jgi:hypothetical protein
MDNATKRGRKPRHPADTLRTAFWAWSVQDNLGISFREIERRFHPTSRVKRNDGGGYNQPGRWNAYSRGLSDPIGSHRSTIQSGTHLQQAAAVYEESLDIYNSVLWEILKSKKITEAQAKTWINSLEPNTALRLMCYYPLEASPWDCFLLMSFADIKHFSQANSPDVLAVLLIYCGAALLPDIDTRVLIRSWLVSVVETSIPFLKTKFLLFPLIETLPYALGPLLGEYGASKDKSTEQQYYDAFYGIFVSFFEEDFGSRK